MHVLLAALMPLFTAPLPAPPAGDDLARAEADVREVFGKELVAVGRQPAAKKAALARKMIATAAGSRPAARYALLAKARELAIAAGDSAAGVEAVAELVDRFAPEKPQDAASWVAEGHRLWNQASDKRPREKLTAQLEAAECYLRCLDGLEGFQRGAVEKRLRGLGWKAGPIDFTFEKSVEGWKAKHSVDQLQVQGGLLIGRITGDDPAIVCEGLAVNTERCTSIEIRMAVTGATVAQIYWYTEPQTAVAEDRRVNFVVADDGEPHTYRIDLSTAKTWQSRKLVALRIDPAHWSDGKWKQGHFAIDFVRGND